MFNMSQKKNVYYKKGAGLYTNTSLILGTCFSLVVKPELGKKRRIGLGT